jgi:hypothetical protein
MSKLHLPPLPTATGNAQALCGDIKPDGVSEVLSYVTCKKCLAIRKKQPVIVKGKKALMSVRVPNRPKVIPKGFECVQCHTQEGFAHKMSCDPPYTLRKTNPDLIEQLIEVSDQCLTLHPQFDGDKILDRPCNCRSNVKKILKKAGIDMKTFKKTGRTP